MTKKKQNKALLPKRHQPDFFVCDVFDATPKGDSASMEHPIFSLSSKPDRRVRRYEHGSNYIEIKPSSDGLATVFDRDIIIFCISQIMAAKNKVLPVSQVVRFNAHDLLVATNRDTSGRGYEGLKSALERLRGTSISTDLRTGGVDQFKTFGLIDSAEIIRETRDGRMKEIEVKLSDWVFNAINEKEVLTISPDYFRLRKTVERRIYEIARKHCGKQAEWRITLALLKKKTGSKSSLGEFRRMIANIVSENKKSNYFPDYIPTLEKVDKEYHVLFENRDYIESIKTIETKLQSELKTQKSFQQTLLDAGFSKEELSMMENYIASDVLEEAVNAAREYISQREVQDKKVTSSVAIYRTAIKENWKTNKSSNETQNVHIELDHEFESSIKNHAWKEVRKKFIERYGIAVFNSWLKDVEAEKNEENIILKVGTKLVGEKIKSNYLRFLVDEWKQIHSDVSNVMVRFS